MMDVRELDRLVSKTELTPVSKRALRHVRQAVMSGRCEGPHKTAGTWTVLVEDGERGRRMTFSFRRDSNGRP